MPVLDRLQSVTIRSAGDIRHAAETLRDIGAERQMRTAACHCIASRSPMRDAGGGILAESVFGWTQPDERWWARPMLALELPLTAICRYEGEAFWCNESQIVTRSDNPGLANIDMSDFERRAGIPAAIVVPIHLPFGQIGAVSFSPFDKSLVDLSAAYRDFSAELSVYARVFVESYNSTMGQPAPRPMGVQLNKREIECLKWAAAGKTDIEIGAIIGLTRATVRFHLDKAAVKLDAVNRSQCVYKATQLGYLGAPTARKKPVQADAALLDA